MTQVAAGILVSLIITTAQAGLRKKPKRARPENLSRTIQLPAAERRVVIGEMRVGGILVFDHTTGSEDLELTEPESTAGVIDNHFEHVVAVFASHESESFGDVYLDNDIIPLAPFDGGDPDSFLVATAGPHTAVNNETWAPLPRDARQTLGVRLVTGSPDQAADPQLLRIQAVMQPDFPGVLWGPNHRLRGNAYGYFRFGWNPAVYIQGAPNPTVVLRGKRLYDPRTATTGWSDNAALAVRDYLTDSRFGFGAPGAQIDEASVIAAANVCDEQVPVTPRAAEVTADLAQDALAPADPASELRLYNGMVARIASSGSPPTPLLADTDYYVVRKRRQLWQLAASLADARAGNVIALTGAGSGSHTLTGLSELRYSAGGSYDAGMNRESVLRALVSAMAGSAVKSGATWRIDAGAWRPPSGPVFDESDLAGPLTVQWRQKRRVLFNAVKGTFISPDDDWVENDFPAVTDAGYQAEDNGERRWEDTELPFTGSPEAAQRIARIQLERMRRQVTVRATFKLTALQLIASDTLRLSHARYGWDAKTFEVAEWAFAEADSVGGGGAALVINCTLRETDASVYDWTAGQEGTVLDRPPSSPPAALTPLPPGKPLVVEALYEGRDGGGLKVKAQVGWVRSTDAFAATYQLEYRLDGAAEWLPGGRVGREQDATEILDLEPGLYDFRLRMVNSLGVPSDWSETLGFEIFGLPAPPSVPTGVTISAVSQLAVIRWDIHPDLDVRIGGKLLFRHASVFSGALWEQSVSIGDPFQGNETVAVLPLKAGSYLVKAIDASGTPSLGLASVTTAGASILAVAQVDQLVEQPVFGGSHANTIAVDGKLKLDGVGQVDSIADWDLVADLDNFGGTFTSGTYSFSAVLDLRAGGPVRLESMIDVVVFNKTDLWDDRTDPIDQWEDVDGNQAGITGDAVVFVSSTDDDPAGSPTWGPWERLDVADYPPQAFRFELRLSVTDPAYNIEIPTLEISASEAA